MAEVYTISGPFGAPVSMPRSPPLRLQNALKALGLLRGDPTLSKLGVDGIIGPKTVKAVNYAIAQKYVVMKDFPRPELTLAHVRQFSSGIAAAVEGAVKAGGGKFPVITSAPAAARAPKGLPALPAEALAPPAPETDRKWVWWVVGGVSILVALSLVASTVRGRGGSRRRRRDREEADA